MKKQALISLSSGLFMIPGVYAIIRRSYLMAIASIMLAITSARYWNCNCCSSITHEKRCSCYCRHLDCTLSRVMFMIFVCRQVFFRDTYFIELNMGGITAFCYYYSLYVFSLDNWSSMWIYYHVLFHMCCVASLLYII
jgi:hypothetical protein